MQDTAEAFHDKSGKPFERRIRHFRSPMAGASVPGMNMFLWRAGAVAGLCALAACDQLAPASRPVQSPPAPAAPAPLPDFQAAIGQTYTLFAAGPGARYAPDGLNLEAIDRARLWRAMAEQAPGQIVEGGGTEALVFRGCAEQGCATGAAVVAIDIDNGEVFAGVHDAGGAVVLAHNERLEALLSLRSAAGRWDEAPRAP